MNGMKILHIGQMIGGLDIYIRNTIIYNNVEGNEYIIACGKDDKHQPVTTLHREERRVAA